MTLQITSVESAEYDQFNEIMFTVTCGDIENVVTKIFNTSRDQANDNILQGWLDAGNSIQPYVAPEIILETFVDTRREDRTETFAWTIDKMNSIRYNSLTDEQKVAVATFRQEWLDYPNDESATRPLVPEGIF
jgi:hypothetical protein